MTNRDDLELELRMTSGVRSVGFTECGSVLVIQVQVANDHADTGDTGLPVIATEIACRYSDQPIAVEIVRWQDSRNSISSFAEPATPDAMELTIDASAPAVKREQRVRLLAVLTFPDNDELEVHLTYDGRRIIGRGVASDGPLGAVTATVHGLREFLHDIDITPIRAEELDDTTGDYALISCQLETGGGVRRAGIAAGNDSIEASARATLNALNRTIAPHLISGTETT